ncbi:transposase, IS110 family protein [Klebsiella variicola]|nr:hypothetical protein P829_03146 [Klebsiella pneumoniae UCI 26]SAJ02609.1 transposase IS116/IS110/IS902 family protein [Klebsiella aerogenes]SBY03920.1 transposase, IS110 family protein [Klebsiella pneumoniae]SSN00041.1 transposase, IS110 family protein [Klebsiella variicola]HBW9836559.1 hypothetical protein [Klebsiella pneumoniae]
MTAIDQFAAHVGLDWADRKHDVCERVIPKSELDSLMGISDSVFVSTRN